MVLSSAQETHHDLVRKDKFKVPVNRTDVERDWKGRGFSCDLFTDPPGREWNDFVHKDDELVAVVQGAVLPPESFIRLMPRRLLYASTFGTGLHVVFGLWMAAA